MLEQITIVKLLNVYLHDHTSLFKLKQKSVAKILEYSLKVFRGFDPRDLLHRSSYRRIKTAGHRTRNTNGKANLISRISTKFGVAGDS